MTSKGDGPRPRVEQGKGDWKRPTSKKFDEADYWKELEKRKAKAGKCQ